MKRVMMFVCSLLLAFSLAACGTNGNDRQSPASRDPSSPVETQSGGQTDDPSPSVPTQAGNDGQVDTGRRIRIIAAQREEIVFRLNDSPAANAFYQQLPLSVSVEDYAGSEKIFYPPENLGTNDTPMAQGPAGTLAYYAPWGNVAIFYGECGGASGLYELGEVVSGAAAIADLRGEIRIEAAYAPFSSSAPVKAESASTHQAPSPGEVLGAGDITVPFSVS